MKGKVSLWIIVALLVMSGVSAIECQDQTDVSDVPCDVVTPVLHCTDYTYNATSTATGLVIQDGNLTAVGDGTYRFVFTQGYGSYNIFVCENSTVSGSITVGNFEDRNASNSGTWEIAIILLMVAIPFALFYLTSLSVWDEIFGKKYSPLIKLLIVGFSITFILLAADSGRVILDHSVSTNGTSSQLNISNYLSLSSKVEKGYSVLAYLVWILVLGSVIAFLYAIIQALRKPKV